MIRYAEIGLVAGYGRKEVEDGVTRARAMRKGKGKGTLFRLTRAPAT